MPGRLQTEFELKLPKLWFLLGFSGLLALGVVSLIPVPDLGGGDKFGHFISYAMLSAFYSLLVEQRKSLWRILFELMACCWNFYRVSPAIAAEIWQTQLRIVSE